LLVFRDVGQNAQNVYRDKFYLMEVYGKDEQEDLTVAQKKVLKELAGEYKRDAIRAARELGRGM
jgi:hypothetical protein